MPTDPENETPEEWEQHFDFTEDPYGWKPVAPYNSVKDCEPMTDYGYVRNKGFVTQGGKYTITITGTNEH